MLSFIWHDVLAFSKLSSPPTARDGTHLAVPGLVPKPSFMSQHDAKHLVQGNPFSLCPGQLLGFLRARYQSLPSRYWWKTSAPPTCPIGKGSAPLCGLHHGCLQAALLLPWGWAERRNLSLAEVPPCLGYAKLFMILASPVSILGFPSLPAHRPRCSPCKGLRAVHSGCWCLC